MTMLTHEPGTYRTRSGELVHFRSTREGMVVLELEGDLAGRRLVGGKLRGEEMVKLSDDPDWPDIAPPAADPELFAD